VFQLLCMRNQQRHSVRTPYRPLIRLSPTRPRRTRTSRRLYLPAKRATSSVKAIAVSLNCPWRARRMERGTTFTPARSAWVSGGFPSIGLCEAEVLLLLLSGFRPANSYKQACNGGGKPPRENFSPPLEKCVGHNLKILDIVQKNLAPQKTLRPSWCPKLATGLVISSFTVTE